MSPGLGRGFFFAEAASVSGARAGLGSAYPALDGWLQRIGGRAQSWADAGGQYMGLLRFTPAGWAAVAAYLRAIGPQGRASLDMTSLLSALLARGTRIAAIGVAGRWCEVDCASDIELYEQQIRQGGWSHDWRWGTPG